LARVKREGRAIALLATFEVAEEWSDVSEEQVSDLGLLVNRGGILANGFLKSQYR